MSADAECGGQKRQDKAQDQGPDGVEPEHVKIGLFLGEACLIELVDQGGAAGQGVQAAGGHHGDTVDDAGIDAQFQEVLAQILQGDVQAAGGGAGHGGGDGHGDDDLILGGAREIEELLDDPGIAGSGGHAASKADDHGGNEAGIDGLAGTGPHQGDGLLEAEPLLDQAEVDKGHHDAHKCRRW